MHKKVFHDTFRTSLAGRKTDLKSKDRDVVDTRNNGTDHITETFKTIHVSAMANGPNPDLRKGPNDELLL